jgi:hypothetical protein
VNENPDSTDTEPVCENCHQPIGHDDYEEGQVEVHPNDAWAKYYYPDAVPGVPFRVYRHKACAEGDC